MDTMRTQKLLFAIVWVFLSITFFACQEDFIDDPNLVGVEDPSSVTEDNSLFGVDSYRDEIRGSGIGGPMGLIYGKLTEVPNGRSQGGALQMNWDLAHGSTAFANARTATDSVEFDETDSLEIESCWKETYIQTENSFEYILDFGDGCWFEGEFLQGKLVERGTFEAGGSFRVQVEYYSFGEKYRTISGEEVYEGVWLEDESDSLNWEVEYEFTSILEERIVKDDGGIKEVNTRTTGSEHVADEGLTVQARERAIGTSEGEEYEAEVEDELFFDFHCEEEVIIYTRGIEVGTYSITEGDEVISGEFIIDYGDGTCDNIITVTRGDIVEEIDLLEEWENEESDEWDHHEEEECEETDESENDAAGESQGG